MGAVHIDMSYADPPWVAGEPLYTAPSAVGQWDRILAWMQEEGEGQFRMKRCLSPRETFVYRVWFSDPDTAFLFRMRWC